MIDLTLENHPFQIIDNQGSLDLQDFNENFPYPTFLFCTLRQTRNTQFIHGILLDIDGANVSG